MPFRRSTGPAATLGLLLWGTASPALAGGGGAASDSSTFTVVLFLLGVAVAYLLANFVVDQLQERFLVVSGLEYLVVGALLGPAVPQIDVLGDPTALLPVIALAAGWVGLLRGMELDLKGFKERPGGTFRIVLVHHFVAGTALGAAAYWFFTSGWAELLLRFDGVEAMPPWRELAASAVFLGCVAASDSSEPFDVLKRRYEIEGTLTERLRGATRLGDVFVVAVFGLIFTLFHPPPGETMGTDFNWAAEWTGLTFGIGLGLGLLFTPFLGGRESENGRFLALVGIITFASGAAYFLQLSPLAVNVLLGLVLVNFAKSGQLMQNTLRGTEKPMNLVLYVLAGALWNPPPLWATVVALVAFVALRLLAKATASRIAAAGIPEMRQDLFRGFLAHGEVAVAMAVSFQVVFDGVIVDIAYTVCLLSVVLHDLIAPRLLRALLVDAGDVRRERTLPGGTP